MHRLTYRYRFGGLAIDSTIALAGARRVDHIGEGHHLDLLFHQGSAPRADRDVFTWTGRYSLKLGRIGDAWHFSSRFDGTFIIDPAISRLDVYAGDEAPTPAAIDVLTRRILPRLAIETGALTVHGAALIRDGGAILLFGESGAGKSTLTAALAQAGWSIASDDMTIIRFDDATPVVYPGATGVCLWPDTRAALDLEPARCLAMPGYDDKLRFEPEDRPDADPARLHAVVFLERSNEAMAPRLEPMPIRDAVRRATRQLIALDPTAPRTNAVHRLVQMLAGARPVKLTYPSGYGALPAVTDLLASLV
ncbi:hypothetical protein U1839_20105 [Sphingomonas sp. RT2P30]|uniref:hypothetical protein n=1 Tax=Parasphingomonas halimpatiens TaxID=3096162 RepID=UPI002FCA34F7